MTDLPHSPEQPAVAAKTSRWRTFLKSDIVWSYRHSPITIVASIVALLLILMVIILSLIYLLGSMM